jgi:hypothetical protein
MAANQNAEAKPAEQDSADKQRIKELEDQLAAATAKASAAEAVAAQANAAVKQVREAAAQTAKAEAVAFQEVRSDARIKVKILNGAGPQGRKAVFACVNGQEYMIPREKEVDIPRCVYAALLNAKDFDPTEGVEVARHNVQVII